MRRFCLLLAALAVLATVFVSSPATAQQDDDLRVIARKLDSGDVELGIRHRARDLFPEFRFFDYHGVIVGDWYETDPITVITTAGTIEVVVMVRRTATGRVEVDLLAVDSTRVDPEHPYLPAVDPNVDVWVPVHGSSFRYATAPTGRWLRSAPAVLRSSHAEGAAPVSQPEAPAVSPTAPAAGTCAQSGATLHCSPPAGRPSTWSEYRIYMDTAISMLEPHLPWLSTALRLSGGWSLGDCDGEAAAGCYYLGTGRIVLDQERLAPYHPLVGFGVLIHELAHAYDYGLTPDDRLEDQPSVRHMTTYHVALRSELFADAAKALVLGALAPAGYYADPHATFGPLYDQWYEWGWIKDDRATFTAALNRVPNRPTTADLAAAWQGLCGGCGSSPPIVVWAEADGRSVEPPAQPPGLGVDIPEPPRIVFEIDWGCTLDMLNWPDEPISPECRNDPDVLDYIESSIQLCRPTVANLESDNEVLRRIAEDSERFAEQLGRPTCREIIEATGR
ncbi:MAG: hypothetical protein OXG47_03115 [bacterium]|nr:hypothetical protein [bacterium]